MEYSFHQRAVKRSTRVDCRDDGARRVKQGAESRITNCRGVELDAAVDARVDAEKRLTLTPGEDSSFEFA